MNNFKTATFKDGVVSLDVRVSVEDGTIWLSIAEMAKLFNIGVSTVRRYINTTYNGLSEDSDEKKPKMNLSCTYLNKTKPLTLYGEEIIVGIAAKYKYKNIEHLKFFISSLKASEKYINNSNANQSNIIYNNGSINLDVKVSPEEETVWLTQAQIALLFETTQQNVSSHISNIFDEGELFYDSVHKDFLYTASDGKQYFTSFYNLDLILSVGYRIKGQRAIEFRKWASSILKQYMIKGYAINKERITSFDSIILKLESEILDIEKEIESIKQKFFYGLAKEQIFYEGQLFDAYEYLCSIAKQATSKIRIIDPFFNDKGLSVLSKTQNIKRYVYLTAAGGLGKTDISKFKSQYGNLEVKYIKKFHDRFIIIDDKECYSMGTSINGAGLKTFMVIRLEDEYIIKSIIKLVEQ